MRLATLLYLIIASLAHSISVPSYQNSFKHQQIDSGLMHNKTKIKYYMGNEKIGYIFYTKIPLTPFYALHNLYIYPSHRNKGYGKQLLNYVCDHLKLRGAQKVFIQPGPFEIDQDGCIDTSLVSRELKLRQLITFYKKSQFIFVNKGLSHFAHLLYTCMHIDENADYLMVKVLK